MQTGWDIHQHGSLLSFLHKLADAVLIILAMLCMAKIYAIPLDNYYFFAGLGAILLYPLTADAFNVHAAWGISQLRYEAMRVMGAWFIALGLLVLVAFLSKTSAHFSRVFTVGWAGLSLLFLVSYRILLRQVLQYARKQGMNARSMVVAGAGEAGKQVAVNALQSKWLGLQVLGFYDDEAPTGSTPLEMHPELKVLGTLDDMVRDVKQGAIDQVYVAIPMSAQSVIQGIINDLADATASLYLVPNMFMFEMMQARWQRMNDFPVVSVYDAPFHGVTGWLKRAEDLVLASLILAVIALPMLVIALLVKFTSAGPVLFKQRRYGLNGQVVHVWKFRSMTVCEDGDQIQQAKSHDQRVTKLGAFLRRTSLDELPQFINVLQGSMSIVGPRPHAVAHNEEYRSKVFGYMLRHKVKPGITGLAQVKGWRGETDTLDKMQKRIEYDLEYIRNWTVWLDLKIVALTVLKGFNGRNVY